MPRDWFPDEEDGPTEADRAANLLGALGLGVAERVERVVEQSTGWPTSRLAALQLIETFPDSHAQEISGALGLSPARISRLVRALEKDGLVCRRPPGRDRRLVLLRTLELGTRRAHHARSARLRALRELVDSLPPAWIVRFNRIAERLLGALIRVPEDGLRICRLCSTAVCRGPHSSPCPVVLATSASAGLAPPDARDPVSGLYSERRHVWGKTPAIELWLEPHGVPFLLPEARHLEVVCSGPTSGRLEAEISPEGHLALHAWYRASFRVLERGREIFEEEPPVMVLDREETPRVRVEQLRGDFATRRRSRSTGFR